MNSVDSGGPSAFDAGLMAVGTALLAWGLAAAEVALSALGGLVLFLGLVLPLRWLVRYFVRRRRAGRIAGRISRQPRFVGATAQPSRDGYPATSSRATPGVPAVRRPEPHRTSAWAP